MAFVYELIATVYATIKANESDESRALGLTGMEKANRMTLSEEANPKQIKTIPNVQNGIKGEWKEIKHTIKRVKESESERERPRKRDIWGKPSRRYSNINQNERKYTLHDTIAARSKHRK